MPTTVSEIGDFCTKQTVPDADTCRGIAFRLILWEIPFVIPALDMNLDRLIAVYDFRAFFDIFDISRKFRSI